MHWKISENWINLCWSKKLARTTRCSPCGGNPFRHVNFTRFFQLGSYYFSQSAPHNRTAGLSAVHTKPNWNKCKGPWSRLFAWCVHAQTQFGRLFLVTKSVSPPCHCKSLREFCSHSSGSRVVGVQCVAAKVCCMFLKHP